MLVEYMCGMHHQILHTKRSRGSVCVIARLCERVPAASSNQILTAYTLMCHCNCNGFNIHIIHALPHLFVHLVTLLVNRCYWVYSKAHKGCSGSITPKCKKHILSSHCDASSSCRSFGEGLQSFGDDGHRDVASSLESYRCSLHSTCGAQRAKTCW